MTKQIRFPQVPIFILLLCSIGIIAMLTTHSHTEEPKTDMEQWEEEVKDGGINVTLKRRVIMPPPQPLRDGQLQPPANRLPKSYVVYEWEINYDADTDLRRVLKFDRELDKIFGGAWPNLHSSQKKDG